jgi:serine protease
MLAGALAIGLRGHAQDDSRFTIVQNLGLPAIDEGVLIDSTHVPGAAVDRRRAAILASVGQSATGSGARYVPGRVIVKFKDTASEGARASAMSSVSRTAVMASRPTYADFDIVRIDPAEDPEAAALALGQRPEVVYAQAAYRVQSRFKPNDPLYSTYQWNLPLINMERAWDIQPSAGSAITVAVVDSGLAYQNATISANIPAFRDEDGTPYPALGRVTIPYAAAPQLVGAGNAGRIVAPHDFIWDSTTPFDFDGHGTHVSGTIGQLTNDSIGTAGVAFNVKLMPVKVIEGTWDYLFGAPHQGDDSDLALGIRYAADNGAKVINMSIGRTGAAGSAPVVEAAMRYAVGKGVFIAVAAGNGYEDGNPVEVIAEIASRLPGAVSVASVDPSKAHAYYSTSGSYVELSAPGGSERGFDRYGFVWQQTFDYTFTETYLYPPSQYRAPRFDVLAYVGYIGTSMATPHVSGVAAMLMQQGITDPAAIEDALERTATDLGTPGRDDLYGFGLIDARSALRGLGLAK